MRWEVKFGNFSNETKANLVMMEDISTHLPEGVLNMTKLGIFYSKSFQIFVVFIS